MAQHGSPGIHAGRTTTQNLLSASRRGLKIKIKIKIKSRSKADQKQIKNDLVGTSAFAKRDSP